MAYDTWRHMIFRDVYESSSKKTKIMAERRNNQFYNALKNGETFSDLKILAYIFDLFRKLLKKYSNLKLKEVEGEIEGSFGAYENLVEKNDMKVSKMKGIWKTKGIKGKRYSELYRESKDSRLKGLEECRPKRGIIELVKEDRFGEFDVQFKDVKEGDLKKGRKMFDIEREVCRRIRKVRMNSALKLFNDERVEQIRRKIEEEKEF